MQPFMSSGTTAAAQPMLYLFEYHADSKIKHYLACSVVVVVKCHKKQKQTNKNKNKTTGFHFDVSLVILS